MGHAPEVRQLDHLALLAGELIQGMANFPRLLAAGDIQLRALGSRHAFLQALVVDDPLVAHRASAQGVDCTVVHDAEHPRAHAAATAVVARAAAPQRQERLLHDVLRERSLSAHAIRQREGCIRVAVIDHLERVRAAPVYELHELLVREHAQPLRRAAATIWAQGVEHSNHSYGSGALLDHRGSGAALGALRGARNRRRHPASRNARRVSRCSMILAISTLISKSRYSGTVSSSSVIASPGRNAATAPHASTA